VIVGNGVYDSEQLRRETFVEHVEVYREIGSTNDRALELCRMTGLPLPALVVAERQTSGRGRRDNRWWSPEGALMFSLIIEQPKNLPQASTQLGVLGLAAATAVVDAAESLASRPNAGVMRVPLQIKWPNDVYLGGKKLAGVLAELPHVSQRSGARVVVGLGVNVNNVSDDTAALCGIVGSALDLAETLALVLDSIHPRIDSVWKGDPSLVAAVRARCMLTGRHIELQSGRETIAGHCLGVSDDGGLSVMTADGPRTVHSGTVVQF
jgi:BirA family biotin operon repressor/biotin-[acetyl-CoA-carboxylase] ligase